MAVATTAYTSRRRQLAANNLRGTRVVHSVGMALSKLLPIKLFLSTRESRVIDGPARVRVAGVTACRECDG
jgi:hypothetical protein